MGFDVHSLLYTIASLSASFVAILGGFIASKLISIHGEREAIKSKMDNISQELHVIKTEYDDAVQYMQEDDALDFIRKHASGIKDGHNFKEAYEADEDKFFEYEELKKYWDRAVFVWNRYWECQFPIKLNKDGVPKELADEFSHSFFDYGVCKILWEKSGMAYELHRLEEIKQANAEYRKKRDLAKKLSFEIKLLEMKLEQMGERILELSSPKGMIEGLVIFAYFSVFNIIHPLILSTVETIEVYPIAVSHVSIFLLVIGLLAIFGYFVWMLTTTPKNEESEHA